MHRGFLIGLLAIAFAGIGHAATNETNAVEAIESVEAMAWSDTWVRYANFGQASHLYNISQEEELFRMTHATTNRYRPKPGELYAEFTAKPGTVRLAGREWEPLYKRWQEKRSVELDPVGPDQFILRFVVTNRTLATSHVYWRAGSEAATRAQAKAAIVRIETLSDGAPPNWDLEAVAKAAAPFGNFGKVHLLAWRISGEDPATAKGGSCLVVKESRWGFMLSQVHGNEAEWKMGFSHFMYPEGSPGYPGMWKHQMEKFDERPSNEEIYAACAPVDKVAWRFETHRKVHYVPPKKHKPLTEGICVKTWTDLTGKPPTEFIRKLAEAKARPRPE